MQHYEILGLQFLIGLLMGFYFSDRKVGVSKEGVQFISIAVLTVLSYVALAKPVLTFMNVSFTVISAVVLFVGVMCGEQLRIRLENRVRREVNKQGIKKAMDLFTESVKEVSISPDTDRKQFLDLKIYRSLVQLNEITAQIYKLGHKESANEISKFVLICESVSRISKEINSQEDIRYDEYIEALEEALRLSSSMVEYMEECLDSKLCSAWNTLALSAKTVQMR